MVVGAWECRNILYIIKYHIFINSRAIIVVTSVFRPLTCPYFAVGMVIWRRDPTQDARLQPDWQIHLIEILHSDLAQGL